MRISWIHGCLALTLLSAPATAEDPVVQDVLEILKERGIVDEGQYNDLTARNQSYEEEQESLLGRIEFTGDFRFRMENFWYERDTTGNDRDNRTRLRYRLRIQGKAEINDYVDAVFRIASGEALNFDEGPNRSTNRTLGRGNDFSLDPIFIDRAYLEFKAPDEWVPGVRAKATAGKVYNPFRWKIGKDFMLWDGDLNPEGIAAMFTWDPSERTSLFLNTGYFIADENSTSSDPHVFGVQGGAHVQVSESWRAGARASWYSWRSLNSAWFGRGSRFGNVEDGLTSDAPTVGASTFRIGEIGAYVGFDGIGDWPILVFGHYVKNFDAVASDLFPAAGKEDTAWGLGIEVGDKKKIVALGLGFYRMEANFWPAQFIDSDITDGFTNRQGWHVYGTRQVLPNTELAIEFLWSDDLRGSVPAFERSVADAERFRLRTDVKVKF